MNDWPLYAQQRWAGKRVQRLEDPGMLTGATSYVTDVQLPRMLELAFVRSPVPHARITSIDVEAARAVPGVRAVLGPQELSHVHPTMDFVDLQGALKTPRVTLPGDRVRYVGEPVAAVLADDRYAAEDGADAVIVALEPLGEHEPIHDGIPDGRYFRQRATHGDVDAAFSRASHVARRRLAIQRVVTSALETCGIVADYDAATGELTCHLSTQMPHLARAALAEALGLPTSHVRVICPAMGGAFGGKEVMLPEYLCAAVAAMRMRRPVRWVEDRSEALTAGAHGKEADAELEAAFDGDGRLRAIRSRFVSDTGAYSSGIGAYVEFMVAAYTVPGLYRLDAYALDTGGVVSHKAPLSPFRGVGMTTSQTLREVLMDDAARAIGIDRMELRRRNLVSDGPWQTVLGEQYEPGSWRTAFERALELIDYDGFLERQATARAQGRLIGVGVSPFVEAAGLGSAGGAGGLPGSSHDNATVSIDLSGHITVALPTFSHGQGHRTTAAQLVADMFAVAPEDVRVIDGDTARTPFGMGTFGSRSGVFIAGTVSRAGLTVRDKLLRAAEVLLEAAPEDLELVDGTVGVRGAPSRRIPLAAIAGAAHFAPNVRAELGDPSLTATAFFDPPRPTHSNGTIAAAVEVDAETGGVTIERIVVVEDCGTMVNPMIVEGQVRGGVAQGVGLALLERYVYDETGQPQTTTLAEYLLPRATDMPPIEIEHLETPSENGTGGIKGMAEGPASATPAAVVCAVLDAIAPFGDRIEALPLRPETVAAALAGA
ncbi:MAG TPA: xanthine dehydrogenase family protein molybdopterin-binding subunit [Solirubrobacteraceae bacterium]|nr:xanthine dehydrogenase family protein molybdopterin-binding subunit [Solirubrobacteraceae bacterium]